MSGPPVTLVAYRVVSGAFTMNHASSLWSTRDLEVIADGDLKEAMLEKKTFTPVV